MMTTILMRCYVTTYQKLQTINSLSYITLVSNNAIFKMQRTPIVMTIETTYLSVFQLHLLHTHTAEYRYSIIHQSIFTLGLMYRLQHTCPVCEQAAKGLASIGQSIGYSLASCIFCWAHRQTGWKQRKPEAPTFINDRGGEIPPFPYSPLLTLLTPLSSRDRDFGSRPVHCRVAYVNSAFHPSEVSKSSNSLLAIVIRRVAFTCVGWQVQCSV